jgi:ABC-type polysaccharide/polyol phosphate transport system ATPase subunit
MHSSTDFVSGLHSGTNVENVLDRRRKRLLELSNWRRSQSWKALFERAIGGFIQHDATKGGRDRIIINALKGVSLELNDGDRLGLVGHNGAGKSSLLKVLAGVYEPTVGRVLAAGAITPYFDMVPGMDHEDTGYESIITAGLLLNLKRREIEAKIQR